MFACNGDPILAGKTEETRFTIRLDHLSGKLIWSNKTIIAITPNPSLAVSDVKVYRISGGITVPVVLTAIVIQSGRAIYSSLPLPGDPDQENPIVLGEEGMIYFWRDNGAFKAYRDNCSSFDKVRVYQPVQTTGAALNGNMAIGPIGNIFLFDIDHLVQLDQHTGDILALGPSMPLSQSSLTISSDSQFYVNDGKGNFLILDYNLNKFEALAASGNVYCNPSLSQEGVMVITQIGNKISAYKLAVRRSPVADFTVCRSIINVGESLDFLEMSSYQVDSFKWIFEGEDTRISFERNPVGIRYPVVGDYQVSLKVINAYGSDSLGRACFITVLPIVLN